MPGYPTTPVFGLVFFLFLYVFLGYKRPVAFAVTISVVTVQTTGRKG